jgi:hypothetical protein
MQRRGVENITAIAREAYGSGVSSADPVERAYAAGVEDLARYLLDAAPSPMLRRLLVDIERRQESRARTV